MEEELGKIYSQLLETGFIDDKVTPEMFKSKIGSPETQSAVREHLLSNNFIDDNVTPELFESKISEWSGSQVVESSSPAQGDVQPDAAPEEQYDIIPMNDDGTDAIPEGATPMGSTPIGTVAEVEALQDAANRESSIEDGIRAENGLSQDAPVSVQMLGEEDMTPTQLAVNSHNQLAELYNNSADYAEYEDDTSFLTGISNSVGDAVDGIGYWLSTGSNEMSSEKAEELAAREGDTKKLRAEAVGGIDSKLPDDLPVLNLEAATDIVVSKQEADENIKTTTITATEVSQALKTNSDRLNEISSFRISKLTDKEQEIFSNLANTSNEGDQLKELIANPEFIQNSSTEVVRAVKGRIAALDQYSEMNKEVDKYSGLVLNISSIVKDAKGAKNDDGSDLSDKQIRDEVNQFLDSDSAREMYSGDILDAAKRSVAENSVYTNFAARGLANTGSLIVEGAGAVKDYLSNVLGFGDRFNEVIDVKAELGEQSLDSLSEGITRALTIEGSELQESAIFTDVIEKDGILYEIQKDGKGNDIVVGERDAETKKKIQLLQPYSVEGSDLNIDDLKKSFNATGLANQGWRTFMEMIPMIGGGVLGGATKVKGLGYLGTATGTTLTMFDRGMKGYLEGGASYEEAGAGALLESFLVAGLESVVGIEKSVIAKLSGETTSVVKTITTEAMKKGVSSFSKPADIAKLLSETTRKLAVKSKGVVKEVKNEVLEEMVFEKLINMAITEKLGLEQEEFTVNGALTELVLTMAVSGPLGVFTSQGDMRNAEMVNFAKENKEETLSIFDQLISEASTEEDIQRLEGSKEVFVNTIERESFLGEVTLDEDDRGTLSGLADKISELEMESKGALTERGRENARNKAAELTEYMDAVGQVAQTGNPIDVKKGSLVRHDGKVYRVGDINSEEGYTLTPLTSDKQIKTKALNDVPAKKVEKKSSPTQSAEAAVVTPIAGDQVIATETGEGREVVSEGEAGTAAPKEVTQTPEQIEELRVRKEATVKQVAAKQKEVDTINETVKTQEATINSSFKPDNSVEIIEKLEVGDTVDVDGSDYQLFEDGEYYQVTTAKGNPVKGGKGRKLSKAKKSNIEAQQSIAEQGAGVQSRLDNGDTPLQILNDISKSKDGKPLVVEDLPSTIANRESIIENYNSRKEGLSSRNSLQDDITNLNKGNEQVQGNTGGVQSNGGVDGNATQQAAEPKPIVQGSVRPNGDSTQQEVEGEKAVNEGDTSNIKLNSGKEVPVVFSDGQWRKQKKDGKPYAKALPQARQDELNSEVLGVQPTATNEVEVETKSADVVAKSLEKLGTTRSEVKGQIKDNFTTNGMTDEQSEQVAEAHMIAIEAMASTMSELDAVEFMAQSISNVTTLTVEEVKDMGSAKFSKSSATKNAIVDSDSVPVKETKELSAEVMAGNDSIGRLSKAEEAGTIAGGERAVQATIIASRSEGKDTRDPNKTQREELTEWAEQEGILFEEEDPNVFGKPMDEVGGDEQNVYLKPGDNNTVVKSNDLSMHETPSEFFDRLAIHNMLFPEAAYTVVGVSKRNGKFSIVIEQPVVDGTKPTTAELDSDMEARGYTKSDNPGTYYDGDHVLDDVKPSNAKKLPSGEIVYFDTVIGLNTIEDDFGGEREANPINSGSEASGVSFSKEGAQTAKSLVDGGSIYDSQEFLEEGMAELGAAEINYTTPEVSGSLEGNAYEESNSSVGMTDEQAQSLDDPETKKPYKSAKDFLSKFVKDLSFFNGIPTIPAMSDNLAAGTIKDGAGNDMELNGGLLFNVIGSANNTKLGWAGVNEAGAQRQLDEAVKLYEDNKVLFEQLWAEGRLPEGHVPMAVLRMADTAIDSNEAVFRFLSPFLKTLPLKNRKAALDSLKESLTKKAEGASKTAWYADLDTNIANGTLSTVEDVVNYIDNLISNSDNVGQTTEATKFRNKLGKKKKGQPRTIEDAKQDVADKMENLTSSKVLKIINDNNITTLDGLFDLVVEGAKERTDGAENNEFSLPIRSFINDSILGAAETSTMDSTKALHEGLSKDKKDEIKKTMTKGFVLSKIGEPFMNKAEKGDVMSVVGIDVREASRGIKRADHNNYGWGPVGRPIALIGKPKNGVDVFPEWEAKASRVFKKSTGAKGKFPDAENVANQTGGAFYVDKAFRGALINTAKDSLSVLIGKLRFAFPNVGVALSPAEFNSVIDRPDVRKRVADGSTVYGVTVDGKVFLNPDRKSLNTPIHEFGHIWIDYLGSKASGKKGSEFLARGLELVKGTKAHKEAIEKYGDTPIALEEALVALIANRGEALIGAAKNVFKNWMNGVFKYIQKNFITSEKVFKKSSGIDVSNVSLDEFINTGLADLFKGKDVNAKFDPTSVDTASRARLSTDANTIESSTRLMDNIVSSLERLNESAKVALKNETNKERKSEIRAEIKENAAIIKETKAAAKDKKFSKEGDVYRGAAVALANGKHILAALGNTIPTTFQHEIFHAMIEPALMGNPKARKAFIEEYNEVFGDNATEFNEDVSEYAARVYETYLSNGRKLKKAEVKDNLKRATLQKMFDTFTETMKEFYGKVLEYNNSKGVTKPIAVSEQSQEFFDRVLGIKNESKKKENESNEKDGKEDNKSKAKEKSSSSKKGTESKKEQEVDSEETFGFDKEVIPQTSRALYNQFLRRVLDKNSEVSEDVKAVIRNIAKPPVRISDDQLREMAAIALEEVDPTNVTSLSNMLDTLKESFNFRKGTEAPFEVVAIMELIRLASDYGHDDVVAQANVALGEIFSGAGRTLRLARADVLEQYQHIVLVNDLMTTQENKLKYSPDGKRTVKERLDQTRKDVNTILKETQDERIEMAMDAYNAKQSAAPSNEASVEVAENNSAAKVVSSSRADLKSAAKFKAKAAKARAEAAILFKKSVGLSSGINANLIMFASKHVQALVYESAGSLVLAKKKLKKIFKDSKIALSDSEFNTLFDLAVLSDEVKNARAEVLKTKLVEKLREQGKKQTPNSKDPFTKLAQSLLAQARKQGGLNNNGAPVRTQKEAVEVILQQLEDNKFQLNTIKDAINDVALLTTATNKERAELTVQLENLMSKITGAEIGKSQIRREMRADAKEQGKTIARIIKDGELKNGTFKQDLITRLITEAGLTGQQALDVEAELEKSFEAIIGEEKFKKALEASFENNADLDKAAMEARLAESENKIKELEKELADAKKASNFGKGRSIGQVEADIKRRKKENKTIAKKLKKVKGRLKDFLAKPRFQQSEKNLIAAAKSGQLNDQHIQSLFEEAFGLMSLTPSDIKDIEVLAAKYGTALTNASREKTAEKIADFFEKKRILDPTWAEMVGSFSYTNMLSGITTPQTALLATAGIAMVQESIGSIVFDIIPALVKLDAAALRSVYSAMADGIKYTWTVGIPEAAKVIRTGKSTAQILDSDGQVAYSMRSKVEAKYIRYMKSKHSGIGNNIGALIGKALATLAFGIPLMAGVRVLYAVDPLVTPGLVRFSTRREALASAKRYEGTDGKRLKGAEMLAHIDSLVGSTEATNDFIAQEQADIDAVAKAELATVKGSSLTAMNKRRVIRSRAKNDKRLAEYTIQKQFTEGTLIQAATDYVKEVALMNEVEGFIGSMLNPLNAWINRKTGSPQGRLGAVGIMIAKIAAVPFLRLSGNALNMSWRLTPLSLLGNYREVLDSNGEPTGEYKMKYGLRMPKHKVILNSTKKSESRPLTAGEQQRKVLFAVLPTMITAGLAMLMFTKGDCEDEPDKTCLKLREDSNFVITGSGEGYGKDLAAGEVPNTIYRRKEDGTLESMFEFKDIPVLRNMFGFVGELSDQIRRNVNDSSDNVKFSAENIIYYMGKSWLKGAGDSGILNSAENIASTLEAAMGLMTADANYRAEGQAIRDLNRIATNTVSTMLPMNANLYKKSVDLGRKFFGLGSAEADVSFLTDNKFADAFTGQYAKGILSPLLSQERLDAFGRPDFSKTNLKFIPDVVERKIFYKASKELEKRMEENPYKIINKFESYDDFKPTFLSAEVTKSSFQTTDGDEFERVISLAPKAILDKYEREADNLKYEILNDNYDELDELNEVQLTQTLNSIQAAVKQSIKAKLVNELLEKAGVEDSKIISLRNAETKLPTYGYQQLKKSNYIWKESAYGPKYNGTKMIDQMILAGIRLEEDGTITNNVRYKARDNKKFQKAIKQNRRLYDEDNLEKITFDD